MRKYHDLPGVSALLPRDRRQGKADVGQHVIQIAFLGVDHALDLAKLLAAKAPFGKVLQQGPSRVRLAP